MKRLFVLPGLCFALVSATLAADPAAAPAAAASTPDFSSFKTPDDLWKQMDKLQQPPSEKPKSREEAMAQVKSWFATQQQAADAFVKAFPDDPRSWNARMIALRASMQMRRFGAEGSPEADQQKLNEIINSPEAPATVKGEAAFMSVMMAGSKVDKDKPETFAAFHKGAADFFEKYADHPLASQLKSIQIQVLDEDPTPEGTEILKKLAA
ncbi:MAG TPA: hypothetical protein VK961_21655, partial [Chthoniobacter sp.]|nr:hypothetical protein [Chthoniobacter sp.]